MQFFLLVFLLYVVIQIAYSGYYFRNTRFLLKDITTLKTTTLGDKQNPQLKLFIDGDSVAAGVGATSFETSVAGRIAAFYAKAHLVTFQNNSVSGKKMADLLDSEPLDTKQDVIILIVSSNDLFHLTNIKEFKEYSDEVVKKYTSLSKKLIIVGPGNLSDAKLLPFFARWFYKYKSSAYEKVLDEEVKKYKNSIHVKVKELEARSEYGDILAKDKFHPNDSGHKFWFDTILPNL